MQNRFLILFLLLMGLTIHTSAQIAPVVPDTVQAQPPIKDVGPEVKPHIPGTYPTIVILRSNGQMLLHFSQVVSCDIQLVDMQGHPQLMARVREEDFAILDISRLHGRFQLLITSEHWYASKAYWLP